MQASHNSLLRRTIEINLEFELKQQLFPSQPPQSSQQSQPSWKALEEARETNPEHAKHIVKEWFNSESGLKNFLHAVHLLKSVSSTVHPVKTIKGRQTYVSLEHISPCATGFSTLRVIIRCQ
jgi:hypothetical protein